ncbi:MAG: MFS transporter, partial [Candidatus Hodarchaeales archaeon]
SLISRFTRETLQFFGMPITFLLRQQMNLLLIAVAITECAIASSVICLPLYFYDIVGFDSGNFQYPIILTAGYLVSLTTASFFGSISDRVGRRPLLIIGTALGGLSFIPLPVIAEIYFIFEYGFILLVIINVLKGLAASMMAGPIMAMFGDLSPDQNHGETMGKFYLARSAGGALGMLVGGLSWDLFKNTSFLFFSAIMFVACALYLFRLFEPRSSTTGAETETIQELKFQDIISDSEIDINPFKLMIQSLQDKQFRKFAIVMLVYTTVIGAGGNYAPVIITQASEEGLPVSVIGIVFLIGIAIMGIIQPTLGKMSDKFGRKPFLILGVIGTSLLLAVLTSIIALEPEDMINLISTPLSLFNTKPLEFIPGFPIPVPHILLVVLLIVCLLCTACFTSSSLGLITDVTKEGNRGREMGFTQAIMSTGSILGVTIGGAMFDLGGPLAVMYFCFGFSLIAIIIIVQFLYETSGFYHFTHKLV